MEVGYVSWCCQDNELYPSIEGGGEEGGWHTGVGLRPMCKKAPQGGI